MRLAFSCYLMNHVNAIYLPDKIVCNFSQHLSLLKDSTIFLRDEKY